MTASKAVHAHAPSDMASCASARYVRPTCRRHSQSSSTPLAHPRGPEVGAARHRWRIRPQLLQELSRNKILVHYSK